MGGYIQASGEVAWEVATPVLGVLGMVVLLEVALRHGHIIATDDPAGKISAAVLGVLGTLVCIEIAPLFGHKTATCKIATEALAAVLRFHEPGSVRSAGLRLHGAFKRCGIDSAALSTGQSHTS
eukprot:gnl/TRDRNA2_/TRDRNA2_142332_c1_seq1.p1 gnl/TRDRNA2_/TRDRNA2_142332_c1~~gnl/TRDRNA2_/TRDRNA2_142332_c1_seq1.p1  ORF type:complete len:124 (+),score=7.95 gnl/TRDRNA2_/TRDRNA2_142332_c1_seq1:86-457(+)